MFNAQIYQLRLLIDKISLRERYLVLVVLFALVVLIAQGFLMVTGLDKHDAVQARIEKHQQETQRLQQLLRETELAVNNPNIQALQLDNRNLREKITVLQQRIGEINERLMTPKLMIGLLKELMAQQRDLTVLSFEVLPVKTIESNLDGASLFYQHGLSLQLEGTFEALSAYLAEIEANDRQLFWDDLVIETESFPILRIELQVHTLSQSEEWLNV